MEAAPRSSLAKSSEHTLLRNQAPLEDPKLAPASSTDAKPASDVPEVPVFAVSEPVEGFFMEDDRGKCMLFVLEQLHKNEADTSPDKVVVGLLEKRSDARKPDIWVLCEDADGESWQLKKLETDNFGLWAACVTRRPQGTMDWRKTTDVRHLLGRPRMWNGERFKSMEAWPGGSVRLCFLLLFRPNPPSPRALV